MPHPRAFIVAIAVVFAVSVAGCSGVAVASIETPPPASEPTVDDGYIGVGDSVSPFDDVPAITNLDPALRDAMQAAATDAIDDGFVFVVTSGWRSAAYQSYLLQHAIAEYGSEAEARKWVSTPELSAHVTGNAVDIGYTDANSWLSQHGSDYGLCQTYSNEMWHFELSVEPGGQCPEQLPDATG